MLFIGYGIGISTVRYTLAFITCCDLLLANQDVLEGEWRGGQPVLLQEAPPPLPGDQAEGLVPVSLAQARDRDQPPRVPHLFHKVLGCCGEHDAVCSGQGEPSVERWSSSVRRSDV